MSDLFGNHIVGFPTRRLILSSTKEPDEQSDTMRQDSRNQFYV